VEYHGVHAAGNLQPRRQLDSGFKQQEKYQQAVDSQTGVEYYVFDFVQELNIGIHHIES
jgi:hypothetical protein